MLRFFRNIRQKLIEQENVRKYIWYALGEILLVMIGILLALQVNNWNEERLIKLKTIEVLKEIKQNLYQDLEQIDISSISNEERLTSLARLSDTPETIPDDSLAFYFDMLHRVSSFDPVTFGYAKLQEIDLPESIPDSLTQTLAEYYTEYGGGLNNISYQDLSVYNLNQYRDYMIKKGFPVPFLRSQEIETAAIETLKEISGEIMFKGIVRSTHYSRSVQRTGFTQAEAEAMNCLSMINNYLNSEGI